MADQPDGVPAASLRTLRLEIDAGADPISGRLGEDAGPGEPFVGWLGLARALERALEAPPLPSEP